MHSSILVNHFRTTQEVKFSYYYSHALLSSLCGCNIFVSNKLISLTAICLLITLATRSAFFFSWLVREFLVRGRTLKMLHLFIGCPTGFSHGFWSMSKDADFGDSDWNAYLLSYYCLLPVLCDGQINHLGYISFVWSCILSVYRCGHV